MSYKRNIRYLPDTVSEDKTGSFTIVAKEDMLGTYYEISLSEESAQAFMAWLIVEQCEFILSDLLHDSQFSFQIIDAPAAESVFADMEGRQETSWMTLSDVLSILMGGQLSLESALLVSTALKASPIPRLSEWQGRKIAASILFDEHWQPISASSGDVLQLWETMTLLNAAELCWETSLRDSSLKRKTLLFELAALGEKSGAYSMMEALAAGVPEKDVLA